MYGFQINKALKQHRGQQPEHPSVTVHAHATAMLRPGHEKAKRQSWPSAAQATVSFLALAVVMLVLLLLELHKEAQFQLSSPEDVVAYLRHIALHKAHNAVQAQEVFALAQHIEKVLTQSPDMAAKLQKATADLSAAQVKVTRQEEVLKRQSQASAQQLEELKKQVQQLQGQQQAAAIQAAAASSSITDSAAVEAARLQALATAGDACGVLHNAEFWGTPVVWGSEHRASDAAECCAACHAHKRTVARGGTENGKFTTPCNIWVFCGDQDKCGGSFGECWLKHQNLTGLRPPFLPEGAASPETAWTSGILYEAEDIIAYSANDTAALQDTLVWHTSLGDTIHVQLLPDLAPGSVRELRRAVGLLTAAGRTNQQQPIGHCSNCRIYRAEKGFLVQGVLEAPGAYVGVPRRPNPPQKVVMDRGLVCWAGGGGGPHWFVNMIDNGGFKDDHLCFGKVPETDMAVFDRILQLPLKDKEKPEDMNMLQKDITFNVSFRTAGAP